MFPIQHINSIVLCQKNPPLFHPISPVFEGFPRVLIESTKHCTTDSAVDAVHHGDFFGVKEFTSIQSSHDGLSS